MFAGKKIRVKTIRGTTPKLKSGLIESKVNDPEKFNTSPVKEYKGVEEKTPRQIV